ncbi:MAG: CotH kinase family protein [Verrucomicrobiales bacterium]
MDYNPQILLKTTLLILSVASLCGTASADLVARYDFDDPEAPLADSSGNGHHLRVAGGTNPVWGATTGFGGTGGYDFSADRLLAPVDVNPPAMTRMTWGAWVRTDSLAPGLRKVLGHDNGAWDRTLGLDNRAPNGDFRYTAFTGNDSLSNNGPVEGTPAPANTTDWTFVAASHDQAAKTVTVYVDLDASTTADPLVAVTEPAGFGTGWPTFAIGGIRPDRANEAWDGAIDQVFIYDEALDLAEVTALRNAGAVVTAPQIASFKATPGLISSGESSTLTWQTSGAETLSIDMGTPAISGDSGSVMVGPTVTTLYTLTATNEAGSVTASAAVGVDVPVNAPIITEFMASNNGTLDDGDGNSSDWIEIFNPNAFDISLAGYGLQDSFDTWIFPDVQIGAGEYLIVFASGQEVDDYVDGGGFLHTNFRLSAAGEVLRFLDTDGQTVLFEFAGSPAQQTDVSWGVEVPGGAQGFFVPPTPGGTNGAALGGFVDDTKFDIGRGFYDGPITVTISTTTAAASIAYTTDGTEPSHTNGTVVAAPLAAVLISTTTILRAIAFQDGWAPTNVDTNTYIYLGDVIDQPNNPAGFPSIWGVFTGVNGGPAGQPVPADYEMKPAIVNADRNGMIAALESLPTLSIVADPDDLFSSEGILSNPFGNADGSGVHTQDPYIADRPCSIEWFQPDGTLETQVDCGIRLVGGWSRHYRASPKKSLRLIFKSEFGPSKFNFPLFGENEIDEFDKVQLRATFSDGWVDNARPAQYLRDPFMRVTYLAMGQPGSRSTFVHLYLNGLYWGIYNPSERPDADYGASHFGGSDEDYDAVKHEGLRGPGQAVTNSFEVIDGSAARWQGALAINNVSNPAGWAQFKEYVDEVSLADYILVNTFLANEDWPGKNWYAFGRRDGTDGGFKFSPWDSEYSIHSVNANRTGVGGTNTPTELYATARSSAEFRLLFADRVHKHAFNGGPLTRDALVARYTDMSGDIEPAIDAEAARWGDNPNTRKGNRDFRKSNWLSTRNSVLNNFLANRQAIAISQYRAANLYPSIAAPEFSQHGGVLDPPSVISFVDPPDGTIYYTTDGSDPRFEGGAVNPAAGSFVGGSVTESFFDFEANGWRYFVTPTSLGDSEVVDGHASYDATHWKHPDFDDSLWPTGQALLGYGSIGSLTTNTTIGFGGNRSDRNRTTYFRKDFTVADALTVSKLLVDVIRDDGAIVYINGHEIGRTNMDAGNRVYSDFASSHSNPEDEIIPFTYVLGPSVLRTGDNTLAIEVHQRSAGSSDLGIDAKVRGVVGDAFFALGSSATVKARVLSSSSEWSALTEAFFFVAAQPASAPNLVISKIHYRPAEPTQADVVAGFAKRSSFEFLELYNFGSETVSLAGVTIGGAINFAFAADSTVELAPGERAVIVADSVAFEHRYGLEPRIIGQFQSGKLDDDGEEIAVWDAAGAEIWRFTYNDAGAWPDSPDGAGPALVLVDPDNPPDNAGMSLPGNWRASASAGGDPGSDDRTQLTEWLATQADPDPLADPDGDGINQLLAFTTGALDGTNARRFLPLIGIEPIEVDGIIDDYAVFSLRLLNGGIGIQAMIQNSSALPNWQPINMVLLSNTDHFDRTSTLRYRSETPIDPDSRMQEFFRLSVSAEQ